MIPSDTDPPRPEIDPSALPDAPDASSPADAPAADAPGPDRRDAGAAPSDGNAPNGIAPNGIAPNGIAPNDDSPDGAPSAEDRAAVAADIGAGPADVDAADPDADALSAIPLAARVEAALFAAPEPLLVKRLKDVTGCPDGRLLAAAIDALRRSYHEQGRAFRIEETSRGYQIRTSAEVAVVVHRLGRRPPAEEKLSPAALETLAVVAYRQPVMRADIEKIRGVACGEVLRALQERGLVRVAGRADQPGSPILYGTTQRFLEVFGIRAIEELPRDREVLRA